MLDEFSELLAISRKIFCEVKTELTRKKNSSQLDETKWFEENKDYFKFYGRDMETLLSKTKIAHSRRVFCLPDNKKRIISLKDLDKGLKMYLENEEVKNRKETKDIEKRVMFSMYS